MMRDRPISGVGSPSAISRPAARLLIVTPHASYRVAPFVKTAAERGVDTYLLAARSAIELPIGQPGAAFDPGDLSGALDLVARQHDIRPFDGICATDDSVVEVAAIVARQLGLVFNDPAAAALSRDKLHARRALREAGLPVPEFVALDCREVNIATGFLPGFPLVLKPLRLSASRGVIRVDHEGELRAALDRIRQLLKFEFKEPDYTVLAEQFIPGFEVAVEGLLTRGDLEILAIFDKPEPLVGPYFEETFYTTPTRLGDAVRERVETAAQRICDAYGLREGPIHAEFRINDTGAWLIELAARTIGGNCARLLRIATGYSLEELVIDHALQRPVAPRPVDGGAGVLMLPVPRSGVVRRVEGISAARKVPGVVDIEIDVATGQLVTAWPEGGSYPGFVFSRGASALDAERSLRLANEAIEIVIAPVLAHGFAAPAPRAA